MVPEKIDNFFWVLISTIKLSKQLQAATSKADFFIFDCFLDSLNRVSPFDRLFARPTSPA